MSRNLHGCSALLFVCIIGLFFNRLVFPVTCSNLEDQKAYYAPPDPPSTPVYGSPPHIVSPPREHGGSPHHHQPPPSPPSNCGIPPSAPTPSRPSTPPSGGYYDSSPPTPVYVSPPSNPTPIVPVTPTPIVPITPTTPSPIIPVTPTTPTIPSPPFPFDPNSPFGGGTCNFWRNNPTFIWGVVGWYAPLGPSLGIPSTPGFPSTITPLQALSNRQTDGYGALYREGTASFLNSMVNHRFPFTTTQVRNSFIAALGSDKAAGAQARVFRMANEGHLKPRV